MDYYYLGLDVSTQSTKLVLLDYQSKEVVFNTSVNYDFDLPHYQTVDGSNKDATSGSSESDPNMWIEAVNILFQRLKESKFDQSLVRAISVSGQQHGLVCLDQEGNLTRRTSKLWNDTSTSLECEELEKLVGGGKKGMLGRVFNTQRPGYTASKILSFKKENPEQFKKTATFFLVHNYINWFLTGGKKGGIRIMEPGDTSGMALWNIREKQWDDDLCQGIDQLLLGKLPEVAPSDQFIGNISEELCTNYGFSGQCRIDAGSGDNMYGALGTGNVKSGILTVSLGTSGTAYTILSEPYISDDGDIASFCDSLGNYMPLLCVSNMANGYNEILKKYCLSFEQFEEVIAKTEPGNNNRILIPWFQGERTPDIPQAKPVYLGFNLDDFNQERLSRAVLEGHILNLYQGTRKLPIKVKTIYLTGGLAKSQAWKQTIADIFDARVIRVKGEGAALGAAIHAAWVDNNNRGGEDGTGNLTNDLQAFVDQFVTFDNDHIAVPDPQNVSRYNRLKAIHQSLYQLLQGTDNTGSPFDLAINLGV